MLYWILNFIHISKYMLLSHIGFWGKDWLGIIGLLSLGDLVVPRDLDRQQGAKVDDSRALRDDAQTPTRL